MTICMNYLWKFSLLVVLILVSGFNVFAQPAGEDVFDGSQVTAWSPIEGPIPLLAKNGKPTLAIDIDYGSYTDGIVYSGLSKLATGTLHNVPEFVVGEFFECRRTGDMDRLRHLFPGGPSAEIPARYSKVPEFASQFAQFVDFELDNKALFGPFVSIGYDLITSSGERVHDVVNLIQISGRYYLTDLLSPSHIFMIAGGLGFHYKEDKQFVSTGMRQIVFSSNPSRPEVIDYGLDQSVASTGPTITIYCAYETFSDTNDLLAEPGNEIVRENGRAEFLRSSLLKYRNSSVSAQSLLELWDEKGKQAILRDLREFQGVSVERFREQAQKSVYLHIEIPSENYSVFFWSTLQESVSPASRLNKSFVLDTHNKDKPFVLTPTIPGANPLPQMLLDSAEMDRSLRIWMAN